MPYVAATTDVLTEGEARNAVGHRGRDVDDILQLTVAAVTSVLDHRCGPVVRRTVTDEVIATEGRRRIEVRHGPVTSFTTIQESDDYSGIITLTLAGFGTAGDVRALPWTTTSAPYSGVLERIGGHWAPWARVTYVAGRYADTGAVPGNWKRAAVVMLKNLWRDMQDGLVQQGEFMLPTSSFPGHAWANAARDVLLDERKAYH